MPFLLLYSADKKIIPWKQSFFACFQAMILFRVHIFPLIGTTPEKLTKLMT